MSHPLPLKEQLRALEHVQEIDLKIDGLKKNKGTLPAALRALDDKLADLKAKNLKASIKDASPEYLVAEGADKLKKYGLENPRFAVTLKLKDGKELKLAVGEESSFDQSLYYTRGSDNHVYLAESGLRYPLDKGLFDLRDKSIVTHEDKDVQSFTVSGNGVAPEAGAAARSEARRWI